jgi:hypothetical protein
VVEVDGAVGVAVGGQVGLLLLGLGDHPWHAQPAGHAPRPLEHRSGPVAVAGGAEGGGQAGHGLGGDPGLGAAVGGPGLALEPPGRRLRLAAPQLEGAHGPGHPGHEHVVLGPLAQPEPHDLEAGVGLAAVGEHEREHAAGAAHPVVVAEGLGDPHRLLGQPPGLVEPAGGERAARLESRGWWRDPPVPAQEPLDGRRPAAARRPRAGPAGAG